jgi:hypothetical protein
MLLRCKCVLYVPPTSHLGIENFLRLTCAHGQHHLCRNTLGASQRLQRNGSILTNKSYNMRKTYFLEEKTGLLRQKVKSAANNPMQNPNGMADMMKGQMTMMVTNIVMSSWINNFFSGFVLGRT